MEFYDVMKGRRSIRGFRDEPVPADSIQRIFEAVRVAPTACNKQPFKLLLVRNAELREGIVKIYGRQWLGSAPAIAVMTINESEAWRRPEGDSIACVDAAIAMEHFMLAAVAEGLGICWICAFDRHAVNELLGLNASFKSFAISPLGFADAVPSPFKRKDVGEITRIID